MLRPATSADFPFIHALASRPDYAHFITDEDDAALAAYLADAEARLLIWERDASPAGYALFCGIGAPSGVVELRRLALAEAGQGLGRAFVRALVDFGFKTLNARKLWLDASGENLRAQRTYARAGFTLEGRQRQHWFRPITGQTVDLMLYGMLRSEWESLEPVSAQS